MRTLAAQATRRTQAHQEVKLLMANGRLLDAIEKANAAVHDFGSHVGLLCDLAGCQYELGQFRSCWATTDRIKAEFAAARDVLSPGSARRTLVFLSKLTEERGELNEALEYLKAAHAFIESEDDLRMVLSQELRILSFLGPRDGLAQAYTFLLERVRHDERVRVEVEHALLWAEASLFGFDHASHRWNALIQREMPSLSRRVMARDFLEIAIYAEQEGSIAARRALEILKQEDDLAIDRFLVRAVSPQPEPAENQGNHAYFEYLTEAEADVSPMMRIRIILISAKTLSLQCSSDNRREPMHSELRRRVLFLISSLSKKSGDLLLEVVNRHLAGEDPRGKTKIILQPHRRAVRVLDQEVKLTPLQMKLLQSLIPQTRLTLEEVAGFLWGGAWSEEYYDRIRMLVYRTNAAFKPALGFALIDVRKEGLNLHASVEVNDDLKPSP